MVGVTDFRPCAVRGVRGTWNARCARHALLLSLACSLSTPACTCAVRGVRGTWNARERPYALLSLSLSRIACLWLLSLRSRLMLLRAPPHPPTLPHAPAHRREAAPAGLRGRHSKTSGACRAEPPTLSLVASAYVVVATLFLIIILIGHSHVWTLVLLVPTNFYSPRW